MKNKIYASVDEAVADIPDGASIMVGGFGGAGCAQNLISAIARRGVRDLTIISNNCGTDDAETGMLFKNRQVRHVIASFPGPRSGHFQALYAAGEVTLELNAQGTLCERMRATAAAIPAFYTPVGVGTEIAQNKEERVFDGKRYVLETALSADYAFIKAQTADAIGNLVYRKAARNFNPIMVAAAKVSIVEVDRIVPVGELDPEHIVTPSIFVKRIVQAKGVHSA